MRRMPSAMDRRIEENNLKQSVLCNEGPYKQSDKKFKFFRGNGQTRGTQKGLVNCSNKQIIIHNKKAIQRYRSIELVNSSVIKSKNLSLVMSVSSQKQLNTISNNVSNRNGNNEEHERIRKLKKKRYWKSEKDNSQFTSEIGRLQKKLKVEENSKQTQILNRKDKLQISMSQLIQERRNQLGMFNQQKSLQGKSVKKRRFLTQSAANTNNHERERKEQDFKEEKSYHRQKNLKLRKDVNKEKIDRNQNYFKDEILEISDILAENKNSIVDQQSILQNISQLQCMLFDHSSLQQKRTPLKKDKDRISTVKNSIQKNRLSEESRRGLITQSTSFLGNHRYGIKSKGSKKKIQLQIENIQNIYNCSNLQNEERLCYIKKKNLQNCKNSKKDLKSYRNKIKQIRNNTLIMKSIDKLKNVFPHGFFSQNSVQPL